jgi:hypothetical protein
MLVQFIVGDGNERRIGISRLVRRLQTYLTKANARRYSDVSLSSTFDDVIASSHLNETSKINQYSEDVPLRPSTIKPNEVKTHMKKLISMIVISFMLFGFGILPLSDYSLIGFIPILGITLRRKKSNDPQLPEPYMGIRYGYQTKDEYVKERIDRIDKETLYSNKVEEETIRAEEQWYRYNPNFKQIQSLIADNNYCDLVRVYNREVGYKYPDAFYHAFNLIIRDKGTLIGDGQYSIDKTIGEFLHYVTEEYCFDCYFSEKRHMLTAVLTLRDEYGVKFNTPEPVSSSTEPSIEIDNEGTITFLLDDDDEEEMLDDLDLLDIDYDDDEDNDEDELSSFDDSVVRVITNDKELTVNLSSSRNQEELSKSEDKIPVREDKTFDPKDPSTWNEKHKLNAESCVANDPRCATCGDR